MFPPFTLDTVRWRPLEGEGLEHPAVRTADHGLRAESTVIGENEAPPYGARYHLDLGVAWHGRTFVVEEPAGRRTAGCTDTDLASQPATTGRYRHWPLCHLTRSPRTFRSMPKAS